MMSANKRKRTAGTSNRVAILAVIVVVMVMAVFLGIRSSRLKAKEEAYRAREQQLTEEVREEEIRAESLAEYREYVKTKEYIEEAAKDKLGLVNSDEILIKPNE